MVETLTLFYFYIFTKHASTKEKSNFYLEVNKLKDLITNFNLKLIVIGANHFQTKFFKAKILDIYDELEISNFILLIFNS